MSTDLLRKIVEPMLNEGAEVAWRRNGSLTVGWHDYRVILDADQVARVITRAAS